MYKYLIKFSSEDVKSIEWPVIISQGDILQFSWMGTKHWRVETVVHVSKPETSEYAMTVLHVNPY